MLERLLEWDRNTFIYLNGLGVEEYDDFWSTITEISVWTPLFLLFIFLLYKTFSVREASLRLGALLLLVVFITFLTHWVKIAVTRLRPNNDEMVNAAIRILKSPTDYSFFSGHASSSFAITVLVFLFLRNHHKWAVLFFIWPLLFSVSRIFVGVHYPLDIIVGALVGITSGFLFYGLYQRFIKPGSMLSHP